MACEYEREAYVHPAITEALNGVGPARLLASLNREKLEESGWTGPRLVEELRHRNGLPERWHVYLLARFARTLMHV